MKRHRAISFLVIGFASLTCVDLRASAGYVTTITNPVVGPYSYAGPYLCGSVVSISGKFTYQYPCVIGTCIPNQVQLTAYDALDNVLLDYEIPYANFSNVGFGSGNYSYTWSVPCGEIEQNGKGNGSIQAQAENAAGEGVASQASIAALFKFK